MSVTQLEDFRTFGDKEHLTEPLSNFTSGWKEIVFRVSNFLNVREFI